MHIDNMYKYQGQDGKVKISENVPEGSQILEEMHILCSEEGYVLKRKSDSEIVGCSVWLKNGDKQENYEEIEDESPNN